MKTLILSFLTIFLFHISIVSAQTTVVWQTGFEPGEGYTLGSIDGQNSWEYYTLPDTIPTGRVVDTVQGGSIPEGTQCLWIGPGQGGLSSWSSIYRPLDISTVNVNTNYVIVSCKAYPDATYCYFILLDIQPGITNQIARLLSFNGGIWIRGDVGNNGVSEWVLGGQPGGIQQLWHDWSIVLDVARRKITRVIADTNVWDFDDLWLIRDGKDFAQDLNGIRLANSGDGGLSGRAEDYFDSIQVATVPMPPAPPALEVSPGTQEFSKEDDSVEFLVINSGTGTVSYTATIIDAITGLTLPTPSGAVSPSGTLQVDLNRSGLSEGIYRSRIRVDAGDHGVVTAQVNFAVGAFYYDTGFDAPWYTEGELDGQDGWAKSNPSEDFAVVTNAYDSDDTCAYFIKTHFYGAYEHLFDVPDDKLIKFSCRMYIPTGTSYEQFLLVYPGLADHVFTINGDNEVEVRLDFNPQSYYPEPAPTDEWFDYYFIIDFAQRYLLEIGMGDSVVKYTNTYIRDINMATLEKVRLICTSTDGNPAGAALDRLFVQEVEPEGPAAVSIPQKNLRFDYNEGTSTVTIANSGDGYYDYTITKLDANTDWLSVTPTSGRVSNTVPITVMIDRSTLSNGFYYGRLHVDGGSAGEGTILVSVSHGTVYYDTGFDEPYFYEGELSGQDLWTKADPGQDFAVVSNVYEGDSTCAFFDKTYFFGGYDQFFSMRTGQRIKFSARLYIPDNESFEQFLFVYYPTLSDHVFTVTDGMVSLDMPQNPLPAYPDPVPADEWFDYYFVVDFAQKQLVEVGLGTQVMHYTSMYIQDPTATYLPKVRCICTSLDENPAGAGLDQIRVEVVEDVGPPTLSAITYKHFGEGETAYDLPLANMGTGSFAYTATVLDVSPDWLTVSPTNGVVVETAMLNLQVDRTGVAPGYYYSRVEIDAGAAGTVTTLVAMFTGNVYYDTGFDQPYFYLGELNGQDRWDRTSGNSKMTVVDTEDSQGSCGYIYYTGFFDGYRQPLEIPNDQLVKVGLRMKIPTDEAFQEFLLVSPGIADTVFTLSNDWCVLDLPQNPGIPLPAPVAADAWFDYYFVIDYAEKTLDEVGLNGDIKTYEQEYIPVPTQNTMPWIRFTCLSTNNIDAAGVLVDRVYVEVIPEPATVLFVPFMLVFIYRRRLNN